MSFGFCCILAIPAKATLQVKINRQRKCLSPIYVASLACRTMTRAVLDNIFALCKPHLAQARKNAEKVLLDVKKTGEANPSTHLHQLIEKIEKLGQPQLA